MPANRKYLMTSGWNKTSKFLAAFLGGLTVITSVVMALSSWLNPQVVVITAIYAGFILWILLMLLVYWIRKAWVSWLVFTCITLLSALFMYLGD